MGFQIVDMRDPRGNKWQQAAAALETWNEKRRREQLLQASRIEQALKPYENDPTLQTAQFRRYAQVNPAAARELEGIYGVERAQTIEMQNAQKAAELVRRRQETELDAFGRPIPQWMETMATFETKYGKPLNAQGTEALVTDAVLGDTSGQFSPGMREAAEIKGGLRVSADKQADDARLREDMEFDNRLALRKQQADEAYNAGRLSIAQYEAQLRSIQVEAQAYSDRTRGDLHKRSPGVGAGGAQSNPQVLDAKQQTLAAKINDNNGRMEVLKVKLGETALPAEIAIIKAQLKTLDNGNRLLRQQIDGIIGKAGVGAPPAFTPIQEQGIQNTMKAGGISRDEAIEYLRSKGRLN